MCTVRSKLSLIVILLAVSGLATGNALGAENRTPAPDAENEMTAAEETAGTSGSVRGNPVLNVQETALEYQRRQKEESPVSAEGTEAIRHTVACVTCHGPKGGGDLALRTPRIGGLASWYIARQLKLFHRGLRGGSDEDRFGTYMRSSVLLLDNAGIEELAAHYSKLDPEPLPKVVEGDVDRGAEIYKVCSACHGERAEGDASLNTPTLVGQSGPYMIRQLEHFRTGLRGADPEDVFGQQMAPIVRKTLTSRQDSADVVAYIESLADE